MGNKAAFGRPGVLDRLRLWWYAKDRSFRVNTLLGLVVGAVSVGLCVAALAREPAPSTDLLSVARPYLSTGPLPNPPVTVDIRAAGGGVTPLGLPDQPSSTSSTVATVLALPGAPASTSRPPTAPTSSTSRPPAATSGTTAPPAATAPAPQVIYTEVPVPPPAADPTVPPLPSSTTQPTTSAPPTTSPPASTSPTSTSPTTAVTLLPPISLPPLLP